MSEKRDFRFDKKAAKYDDSYEETAECDGNNCHGPGKYTNAVK